MYSVLMPVRAVVICCPMNPGSVNPLEHDAVTFSAATE